MSTTVQRIRGAYLFRAGLAVDADGALRAYSPANSGLEALDRLDNAGRPGGWYGLVTNAAGAPIEQGPNDPAPGYYISTTALCDHSKVVADPARYVDSASVPYAVVPPELGGTGRIHMGDVAIALYDGNQCGAIVADVGPHGHFGEGSIALAEALGIPSSPRTGGTDSGVTWLMFPGSSRGWPRSVFDIQSQAQQLFDAWGGLVAIAQVYP